MEHERVVVVDLEQAREQRLSRMNRLRGWLCFDKRYREYVPAEIRELGERAGAPLPNRYVPSAQGLPARIPEQE